MSRFWAMLALKALQIAAEAGEFSASFADRPVGRRLGTYDNPQVKDKFLNLAIGLHNLYTFRGYFQLA